MTKNPNLIKPSLTVFTSVYHEAFRSCGPVNSGNELIKKQRGVDVHFVSFNQYWN